MADKLPAVVSPQERVLVQKVVRGLDRESLLVLGAWASALLAIREQPISGRAEARKALQMTFASKATWPIVKALAVGLKGVVGDAGLKLLGRVGLVSLGAISLVGSQGAGIAALGGAIAVPLWIVIGSGYAFCEVLQATINVAVRGLGPDGSQGN